MTAAAERPEIRSKTQVLAQHVPLEGARVIDIGAGEGELVRWMRQKGADAVGVECGPVMLERALAADPDNANSYVDAGAQDLPFEDASADALTFCYSLHHVPVADMPTAVTEAARVLKPGGVMYVIEPIPAGPGFEVARLIDDETVVRGHAQDALTHADDAGLEMISSERFFSEYSYPDFDAWERHVVGIDPERAELMAEHRDEVEQRFHTHGRQDGGRFWFVQENDVKVLQRRP